MPWPCSFSLSSKGLLVHSDCWCLLAGHSLDWPFLAGLYGTTWLPALSVHSSPISLLLLYYLPPGKMVREEPRGRKEARKEACRFLYTGPAG